MPSLLWAESVMCRVVPKSKIYVPEEEYLSVRVQHI